MGKIKQLTFSLLSPLKAQQQTQRLFTKRCSHTNNLGPDSAHKQPVEGFCLNSSGHSQHKQRSASAARCWEAEIQLLRAFPAMIYAFDLTVFSRYPLSFGMAALPPMPWLVFLQKVLNKLRAQKDRRRHTVTWGGDVYFLSCGVHILCKESREFSESWWDFRPAWRPFSSTSSYGFSLGDSPSRFWGFF